MGHGGPGGGGAGNRTGDGPGSDGRRRTPGHLRDLPRIARIYFARCKSGTLTSRVIDVRFWEVRSCGWNPWNDSIWHWWIGLHIETRRKLVALTRDFGAESALPPPRRWMPTRAHLSEAQMFSQRILPGKSDAA